MAKRDYYDVLGVSRGASEDDIKRAYRNLAKKHHPDVNPGEKGAEEKFKEINVASEVLGDASKRKAFDTVGHQGPVPGGGGAGGFEGFGEGFSGVDDMFGDLLGSFFGGRAARGRHGASAGEDLAMELELSLEEASSGGERKISFERMETCGTCRGSGAKPGTTPKTCTQCEGRGQVHVSHGFFAISRTCPKCRGRGMMVDSPCQSCRGAGQVRVTRPLTVNVPAGVDNGTRVRLPGEGEPGTGGGPRGDLYLNINVHRHELFERDGPDLGLELPVPFPLATTGGEVDVPSLDGTARLKLPPGTQSGQVFRIRGRGMPAINSRGRGDLVVHVFVEIPRRLTSSQRDHLKEFERAGESLDYEAVTKFAEKVKRVKGH